VENEDDVVGGKIIDPISFNKIPAKFFFGKNLFQQLFSYMDNNEKTCRAIPLNLLITRIKELNISNVRINNYIDDHFVKFEVDEIVNHGLNHVLEKLEFTYEQKGKLRNDEVFHIKQSFMDIANDLKDGGINRGLYEYLHTHIANLSPAQYHHKYQNIMDYLMKVMKNTIALSLRNF
jgi:hypothetical protein